MRFRGPVAIHASTGMTRDEYEDCAAVCADNGYTCPPPADLLRGGIVGVGCIDDIVSEHESPWFFGPKALVIVGAKPVDFIAVGGRLGFFDWRELLPFAKTDKPVEPAKWMLPPEPKVARPKPDQQGTLL
ncbi:hypothetical protein NKI48_03160 [Mesorhizobium sp. M0644]|uniref:hypothetical protein n=1 Tax=Mesorhizobium sp. M0644 TaxID=2956979 RepID=UPI00333A3794